MTSAAAMLVLFTRLDHEALMGHEARRAILDHLRERPGATVAEVSHRLAVDYKTAAHHLRKLHRAGHVVIASEGRGRRCYLPGAPRVRSVPVRMLLALRAVGRGDATPARLARALAIPRGTAGGMLTGLAKAGFLAREPSGYALTMRAREAVGQEGFSGEAGDARAWTSSRSAR